MIGALQNQPMKWSTSPLLLWAISLAMVWCAIAFALHQPIWAPQSSRELLVFGVIKGEYFDWTQSWKLIASQCLHVKAPHMLLNTFVISGVGLAAEARWGRVLPGAVALAGGTLSQLLLVILEPQAFLSGASQASMALCGFVMFAGRIGRVGLGLAWAGVLIGFAIDLFISDLGQIKVGHAFPVVFGIASGLLVKAHSNTKLAGRNNATGSV
jgi:membrane associated rhomboid family serine protease